MALDVVPEWAEGVLVCLFGSTLTALGLVLQKHSHIVLAELDGAGQPVPYFCERWWLLGFSCYISAQVINMVAMAMTPQVVLSCLGSWTLVCNTVFARIILRESVTSAQRTAVAGLVVATALVVYNAPRPPSNGDIAVHGAGALVGRFTSPEFEAVTTFLLGTTGLLWALAEGVARTSQKQSESQRIAATAWSVAAAVGTGYTALLFKCIAEILATSAEDVGAMRQPWHLWQTYAIVGLAFSCAPMELHCLNVALQLGEASLVVPMYLTLGMLAQLCTGAVFFEEFRWFRSDRDIASFAGSVLSLLACVVSMALLQVEDVDQAPSVRVFPPADESDVVTPLTQPLVSVQISGLSKRVSVAGFGAAIECFETHQLPPRRHTDTALDRRMDRGEHKISRSHTDGSDQDPPIPERSQSSREVSVRSGVSLPY